MAQKLYCNVGNQYRNTKKWYVNVGNQWRNVKKAYVNEGGVWRQFWGGSGGASRSWDFWTASDNFYCVDDYGHELYKTNKKIAYYGAVKYSGNSYVIIFMSPDPDAVAYSIYDVNSGTSRSYTYNGTITDVNNITWYYCSRGNLVFDNAPDFTLSPGYVSSAVQELLDKIYSVPFHEDYQEYTYYDNIYVADIQKTIRKGLGLLLAFYVSEYDTNARYKDLSDYATQFIQDILSNKPQNTTAIQIVTSGDYITKVYYFIDNIIFKLYIYHGLPKILNYS